MGGLRLRMAGVAALAMATLVGLSAAGAGPLAAPPISSWRETTSWYDQVGAGSALMAGLRLVAIVGVAWVLVGAVLQLLASLSLRGPLRSLADSVSPAVLRRLAHGVAGLSVSAGLAVPALPGEVVGDPPGTAVMQVLDDGGDPAASASVEAPATTTTIAPPAEPVVVPAPMRAEPAAFRQDEVRVQPGDSFWSLALDIVSESQGHRPSDADLVRYWARLIDANRSRLVDPANPDLLFPDQVLVLPVP